MPQARVNGVSLYYEEHGEGEPIVCLHGAGTSAVVWSDAVAAEESLQPGFDEVLDRG